MILATEIILVTHPLYQRNSATDVILPARTYMDFLVSLVLGVTPSGRGIVAT
jgi:hypothetical protein